MTKQSLSHESDHEKQPFSPKKVQFNTRQSFPRGVLAEDVFQEGDSANSSADEGGEKVEGIAGGSEVTIEDSFQERMQNWDELEVVSTVVGIKNEQLALSNPPPRNVAGVSLYSRLG